MSLSIDGVWKAGVWATTVWAAGVWYEPAANTHPVTGNLQSAGATITASATHTGIHGVSGSISPTGATITGSATHSTVHETSGDLAATGAQITGSVQFGTAVATVTGGAGTPKRVSKKVYIEQDGKVLLFASASDASAYVFAEKEKAKAKFSGKAALRAGEKPASKAVKVKPVPVPQEIDIAALEAQQAEKIARDEALVKQETIRQLLAKQDFETLLELQVKYRQLLDDEDDLFLLMVT